MIIVSQYITIYRAVICIISPGSCQYTPITIYVSVKHFKHRTEENKQTKAITSFSFYIFLDEGEIAAYSGINTKAVLKKELLTLGEQTQTDSYINCLI